MLPRGWSVQGPGIIESSLQAQHSHSNGKALFSLIRQNKLGLDVVVDANLYRFNREIVMEEIKVISEWVAATAAVDIAEVEVEIFKLHAPFRAEHIFDARTERPTC
jgi:hypothetical protein